MSLFDELKRRNVIRVGVAYALIAWVLLQGADFALDLVEAPGWVLRALVLLAVLGLPGVLVFAWVFELTPEGLKREKDVDRGHSITTTTGRKLDRVIIIFLVLVIVALAADRMFSPARHADATGAAPAVAEGGEVPVSSRRKSIAVLPFVNRSSTAEDAFFVDGVHDDLLTQLARISALKVISRTSVESYRATTKAIPVIAQELGVGSVLEGSVQRAGDRIRINVQLIDAAQDEHVWAEIYDRELTAASIFDIQSEIAQAIAAELRTALTLEESERLAQRPTDNLAAYEAYLMGRRHLSRRTAHELPLAADYFQRAVDLDPGFALAWVGLADAWLLRVDFGGLSIREANAQAVPFVERALQLDGQLSEAYATLASIHEYGGDLDAAEAAYRRSLELAPNNVDAMNWYGLFTMYQRGRPEDALPLYERAMELDPLSNVVQMNRSVVLEALGRVDEARAGLENILARDAEFSVAHSFYGYLMNTSEGRIAEAMAQYFEALGLSPQEPTHYADIAFTWWELGDTERAECWLGRAAELGPDSPWVNQDLARFALLRGDYQSAVELAQSSLQNHWVRFAKFRPLAIIGFDRLQAGKPDEAVAAYDAHFPELLSDPQAPLNRSSFKPAIDLAYLLQRSGRPEEADGLLNRAWDYIQDIPRVGHYGYWVDDARILMLRGEPAAALDALERAVTSGWRFVWRDYLEFDPILSPLRDEPRFQAALQTLRDDMAGQLRQARNRHSDNEICATPPKPAI